MKLFILCLFTSIICLSACRITTSKKQIPDLATSDLLVVKDDKEQDGIREYQEHEFRILRDVKLGYVPLHRLVQAEVIEKKLLASRKALRTSALTWTERGPNTDLIGPSNGNSRGTQAAADAVTAGRIRAIWFDLADGTNETIWVGSVSGGLWKTSNISSTSAAAWAPIDDFMGNLAIASIAQDPTNTNIMYVGTGEKTFNPDAVLGGGVWKSTDHGVTWSLLANTTSFYNISKVICDATGNIYVATIGNNNGLQRSTDGGATWVNITPSGLTTRVTEMKISNTGRLHIVCGYFNNLVSGYRYSDAPATVTSATWTAPVTTFPTAYNSEIDVVGNVLYALPANSAYLTPTIYKSTDGGANWAATLTSPPGGSAEPSINLGQGWYDLAIGINPANTNHVLAGGLNFFSTNNGGDTWTQTTRWVGTTLNYVHADHHAVVWKGSNILLATDGGIFFSNNNGASFTDRNDGLRMKQFYACAIHPTTTNYFIAGAQDNGTHQLTNPGLAGSIEVIGGDGMYTHIDQDEPQYQFSAFPGNDYIRSTNGGASWGTITYSGNIGKFINPSDYDDYGNMMYAAGSNGQYIRWNDPQTGSSFTPVSIAAFNSVQVSTVFATPYTPNRVFFGTDGGRIVRVDNANAATPSATNIRGTGMSASSVSCVAAGTDDNHLLASFSNYGSIHVWYTSTGGGASGWTNISGNLPDIPVRWVMFYPENNDKAILATEMGIYETDDINGASTIWVRNTSFPFVKTNMLQYRKSDGTLLAATHGRGLWTTVIPFTAPYVRFASPFITKPETTATSGLGCRNYTDYTINMNIDQAPTGNADVTLFVAGGATGTQGVDFDFTTNGNFSSPSSMLTFTSGSTAPQTITIRIYDDAELESAESFTLNYSIGGSTDALAAPSSLSYTFNISDNDLAAVPFPGSITVGNGNFGSYFQPFRSNYQKARSQYIYLASELSAAGLRAGDITALGINVLSKTSTQPYNGLTISLKNTSTASFPSLVFETGAAPSYSQNYSTVIGLNTLTLTTPFNWDGTSNVLVEICFDNATATGSGDNVATHIVSDRKCIWNRAATGTGCGLPAAFDNAGNFVRPDITFSGTLGNPIESTLSASRSEYIGNNGTYPFYTGFNILCQINNATANLGCVSATIFQTGTTWQPFLGGQRSQKVIELVPTTNNGASYTAGFFFTMAELAGKMPSGLKIAKTNAATIAGANASNTVLVTPVVTAFGSDYLFTGNFAGFSKFFLVDNNVTLPVTLISFTGKLNNENQCSLLWKTSNQINVKGYGIERSYDAVRFSSIGFVPANQASLLEYEYTFRDPAVAKAVNYYRLKITDENGSYRYSPIIKINAVQHSTFAQLLVNPVDDHISLSVNNPERAAITAILFTNSGQLYKKWQLGTVNGTIILPFDGSAMAKGHYILRVISATSKSENLKLLKQ